MVVVGGGPAGAATALLLARAGIHVALLDRARFPRDKACGEFLSPAATPILEDLGVREAVEAAGARRLSRVRIVAHGEPVDLRFPETGGAPAWGYALSRRRLDAILLDAARAAGAEVVEGAVVDRPLVEDGRVVGVAARSGSGPLEVRARWTVGAGGRGCPVARGLGLQRRDRRKRFDLLAHWSGGDEPAPEGVCELHVAGGGYVAAAPVEGGRRNVNCVVGRDALRAAGDPEAVYRGALGSTPGLAAWTAGDREGPVEASDVTPLATRRAAADGAVLAGDAALFLDPFTGQGIYLALRSAVLAAPAVASAVAAGRTDRAAVAAYESAREAELAAKRRVSRALQAVLRRPRLARRAAAALRADAALAETIAAVTGDVAPAGRAWSLSFGVRLAAGVLGA